MAAVSSMSQKPRWRRSPRRAGHGEQEGQKRDKLKRVEVLGEKARSDGEAAEKPVAQPVVLDSASE